MKNILSLILAATIFAFGSSEAWAGKGYSSGGGRSYSSGGSSFRSSGSSFSSGRSSSFSSSKPSTSSRGYTSGNKGYTSSGKSYTSGTVNKSAPSTGPPNRKPTDNFQSLAAKDQRKAESREAYQRATAPKQSYTTPKGNSVNIKSDDKRVTQVRSITHENWVHRETRVSTFYSTYYLHPPVAVVHYNDPYSTFFWLWMLDRSIDDRARWAYNHRYDMDDARYRDMIAKDKQLEARIRQLEAEKKARDPNYVPTGMTEPDLQYTDEFVNASVNPTPKPYNGPTLAGFFYGVWVLIKWCFYIMLILGLIAGLLWVIFVKEW